MSHNLLNQAPINEYENASNNLLLQAMLKYTLVTCHERSFTLAKSEFS